MRATPLDFWSSSSAIDNESLSYQARAFHVERLIYMAKRAEDPEVRLMAVVRCRRIAEQAEREIAS